MPPALDLTGQRFGRLLAVSLVPNTSPRRWLCRCDCGSEITCTAGNLRNGFSTSCGCKRRESVAAVGRKNRKSAEGYKKPSQANPRKTIICPGCDRQFVARSHQKFCSAYCRQHAKKRRQRNCPVCGQVVPVDTGKSIYCSRSCTLAACRRRRNIDKLRGKLKEIEGILNDIDRDSDTTTD